jgi:hypothetical protein
MVVMNNTTQLSDKKMKVLTRYPQNKINKTMGELLNQYKNTPVYQLIARGNILEEYTKRLHRELHSYENNYIYHYGTKDTFICHTRVFINYTETCNVSNKFLYLFHWVRTGYSLKKVVDELKSLVK